MYPRIRLSGLPRDRGRQYGAEAKNRIWASIDGYKAVFKRYANLDWDEATAMARRYEAPTNALSPSLIEEIRGIAEGADVAYDDVLAINCRTEIMFAGLARMTKAGETPPVPPTECTAFAVLPERTTSGSVIIGQNWDWLGFAMETMVILEVEQDGAPNFVTVVEAGLLAKFGMNDRGVGLVTNALVSEADIGAVGVPYHMLLRRMLDCRNMAEATGVLSKATRASSANYVLASDEGIAINAECSPGKAEGISALTPHEGYIVHTNHFVSPTFRLADVMLATHADSLFRLQSIQRDLQAPLKVSIESIQEGLRSHTDFPNSVCTHLPDGGDAMLDSVTVASGVMDLNARRMWVAHGQPCTNLYHELDLSILGAKTAVH